MERRRQPSWKSRDAFLGVKPVLPKKRTLNGKHVRATIPETPFSLPDDCIAKLQEAIADGSERAKTLVKRKVVIRGNEFQTEQLKFQTMADGNSGLYHMLMTVFMSRLYLSLHATHRQMEHVSREKLRNMYIVAATVQRELTQACLHLDDAEMERILEWPVRIVGITRQWWKGQLIGALSVARLCHLFLAQGAVVRFSRADEYLNWKIDLIVSLRGHSDGLCVRVESDHQHLLLTHRTFDDIDLDMADDKDKRFVDGTGRFQNKFRGIWKPVEVTIGSKPQRFITVRPSEENTEMIRDILHSTID